MTAAKPAPYCSKQIDGPKIGRLVAWRKPCRNRTRHPSGRCPAHRYFMWYVGMFKSERPEEKR
jgi:hypothetical protein